MPRQKISEFRSKTIVTALLGTPYTGWAATTALTELIAIDGYDSYVVKVDQATKKRFKNGLVKLDVKKAELATAVVALQSKGYEYFIIEPFVAHADTGERYISFSRDRKGISVAFNKDGGVDVEDNAANLELFTLDESTVESVAAVTGFSADQLRKIATAFDRLHISLLEINPYIIENGVITVLDVAIEVDSAAAHLVEQWTSGDVRIANTLLSDEETFVTRMNEESSASFNLSTLNKNGSIFLLLSGGGASVVIADEIQGLGFGNEIANYGEYSGNPSRHESYDYTRQVLGLLLKSKALKKVLFIGGAVANFTDIATTFSGVIDALDEFAPKLQKADVKIYVRRGGPRQQLGLKNIAAALKKHDLFGGVYGPEVSIPDAVEQAVGGVK